MITRSFTKTDSVWIIFDTCTRPEYYQDVHNLLAAPRGWILRYEYREKYLTADAVAAIRAGESLPSDVILLYAQSFDYIRGSQSDTSAKIGDSKKAMWVSTRLGRMVNVVEEGGAFFFDFEVCSYPSTTPGIGEICEELHRQQIAPFWKWVTFSDRDGRIEALERDADDDNWHSIVEQLSLPPSQFAGDVFWRLVGLRSIGRVDPLHPKHDQEFNGTEIRQVRSLYELIDDTTYTLEVTTRRSPHKRGGGESLLPFTVEAEVTNQELIRIVTPRVSVRQYTSAQMEVEVKNLSFPQSRLVQMNLNTVPRDGDWPQGPEIIVRFKVKKNLMTMLIALGALSLGAILGLSELREVIAGEGGWGVMIAVAASALLIALGATLWTGKLTNK